MWAFSDFSPIFKHADSEWNLMNNKFYSWWKNSLINEKKSNVITIPTIETVQKNPRFEFNHGVNTVINRAI